MLSFPTQPHPSKEILTGVIGMSPLILQTTPAPKLLRKAGAAVSVVAPWFPFPAEVPAEVSPSSEADWSCALRSGILLNACGSCGPGPVA